MTLLTGLLLTQARFCCLCIEGFGKRVGRPPKNYASHIGRYLCVSAVVELRWRPQKQTYGVRTHRRTLQR